MSLNMRLKRTLVGTRLGSFAKASRDLFDLVQTPRVALGTTINDQLAGEIVVRLCQPGKTFLDIGAHIGSVIGQVLRHSPASSIIAFEPIPEKADWLRRKFPKIAVHGFALSDADGTSPFFVDTVNPGYSSLSQGGTAVNEIIVEVRTLDGVSGIHDIDVIKLDVEGAELGVLRGANNVISRNRPTIMFESGPQELLGHTKSDMYSWFENMEYSILAPNRLAHTGQGMARSAFINGHDYPRTSTNYFAVANERFDEIRALARKMNLGT